MNAARYKRILVKLSGEALLGTAEFGIDPAMLKRVATELVEVAATGVEVAVVIGGGNIFRGAGLARAGMDRVTADQMGMLATVMNSLAMQRVPHLRREARADLRLSEETVAHVPVHPHRVVLREPDLVRHAAGGRERHGGVEARLTQGGARSHLRERASSDVPRPGSHGRRRTYRAARCAWAPAVSRTP
jgi:hypothetical protein